VVVPAEIEAPPRTAITDGWGPVFVIGFESMWGRQAWLVALPLLLLGSELGQWVLGRLDSAAPRGVGSALSPAHVSSPFFGVSVVIGLVLVAWRPATVRFSRSLFASLPLCVFAAQEHMEYVIGHGNQPWTVSFHRWFFIGLLIQIPFVLLSYLVAKLLIRIAAKVFARRPSRVRYRPGILAVPTPAPEGLPSRARPPCDSRFTRGPPVLST
jgi:hypothetical protein